MAKNNFEGNAARKMPPRQVEQDDEEPITQRLPNASAEEAEPITQRRGKKLSPKELEHELGIEREERDLAEDEEEPITQRLPKRVAKAAEEEDLAHVAKIQKMIDDTQASERLRPKMKAMRANQGLKEQERVAAFSIEPPKEILDQGADFEKMMEVAKQRKKVSLEEARQLLSHGDRVFELVSAQLGMNKEQPTEEDTHKKFTIALEVGNDRMEMGKRYDAATEYVRTLAKYRRAVENGDAPVRQHALNQIIGFNRAMGIQANAEIEQNLEQEDIDAIHKQLNQENIAEKLEKVSKEVSRVPMSIETLQGEKLVKDPHGLWHELVEVETRIPPQKAKLVTEYILSIGKVNKAARDKDYDSYMSEKGRVDQMSAALGLENDSRITDRIELAPFKNPFKT